MSPNPTPGERLAPDNPDDFGPVGPVDLAPPPPPPPPRIPEDPAENVIAHYEVPPPEAPVAEVVDLEEARAEALAATDELSLVDDPPPFEEAAASAAAARAGVPVRRAYPQEFKDEVIEALYRGRMKGIVDGEILAGFGDRLTATRNTVMKWVSLFVDAVRQEGDATDNERMREFAFPPAARPVNRAGALFERLTENEPF